MKFDTKCDIYIGKGVGAQLTRDIDNAKRSIKIISPYTSESTLNKLLELHKKGIDVKLITTPKEGDSKFHFARLINQTQIKNTEEIKKIRRLRKIGYATFIASALIILAPFLIMYYTESVNVFENFKPYRSLYFLLLIVCILTTLRMRKLVKIIRIYNYTYKCIFPFKIIKQDNFIHSKIFVIDDEIAYLGSFNYTVSGMTKNYETRVRFTDKKAIDGISMEFDRLFESENKINLSINELGPDLFYEPINESESTSPFIPTLKSRHSSYLSNYSRKYCNLQS